MGADILHGDKQLIRRLDKLKASGRRRVARKGIAAGAKIVNRATKDAVPAGDAGVVRLVNESDRIPEPALMKGIKKSIGRRKRTYGNDGAVFEAIGPRFENTQTHEGKDFKPSKEAAGVEFGDALHAPKPFMRAGFQSSVGRAKQAIAGGVRSALAVEAAKA